jgi:hypothetical protein
MHSYTILPSFSGLVHQGLLEVTEISRELVETNWAAGVSQFVVHEGISKASYEFMKLAIEFKRTAVVTDLYGSTTSSM